MVGTILGGGGALLVDADGVLTRVKFYKFLNAETLASLSRVAVS